MQTPKLTIATFLFPRPHKWIKKNYPGYTPEHVNALWRACQDNIKIPHRFVCYSTYPDGIECERREIFPTVRALLPDGMSLDDGCFTRLRMYDPEVQAELGTDFISILDLDMVFMRDSTEIFEKAMEHDCTFMEGSGYSDGTPCSWYNGSIQVVKNGARPEFWTKFDPYTFHDQKHAYKMPNGSFPHGTDQAWFTICSDNRENKIGTKDGIYQYRKVKKAIPDDTNILLFSGWGKPWDAETKRLTPEVHQRWAMYA